jgi:hypothetical protein
VHSRFIKNPLITVLVTKPLISEVGMSQRPPITNDFYLGYGCPREHDCESCWGRDTTTLSKKVTTTSNIIVCGWCGFIPTPRSCTDIHMTMDILHLFGGASRLKTNLQKSSVLPIRCEDRNLEVIQQQLLCAIADFPCKYLGLPLAFKKLKKSTYNLLLIGWWITYQDGRQIC